MNQRIRMLVVLALLVLSVRIVLAQSSPNYVLQRFVMVSGSSAASARYNVVSVFGQAATGVIESPDRIVSGGFLIYGTFAVGGTVSGLLGAGLVLQNNGGDDLAIDADGVFTFDTRLADGSPYAVTVRSQPTDPSQTCTVSDGTGTVAGAAVSSVAVVCATDTQPGVYLPQIQR